MKTISKKILIGGLVSLPIITNAQFNLGIAPALRTTGGNIAVGIGNFPTTTSVQSRLHVNNFLLGAPNGPLNGFLFRTDGNIATDNMWQLFTGISATSQTEKFRLFVPANDSAVTLKATASSLILADYKNAISLEEIKKLQQQVVLLERRVTQLEQSIPKK